tara:strand:+ start:2325 stop:2978 length:654 start_codon:yes stop_codon:yes gene_type:complete
MLTTDKMKTLPTELLIARHGNTFLANEMPRRVGITDLPLVESGVQQARRLACYLKQQDLQPDIIFTSELKRTRQTAGFVQAIFQKDIPLKPLAIFNEIDYGPDENQPEAQVKARLGGEALALWETQAVVPQGWCVNPATLIANWQQFGAAIAHQYQGLRILVVTSNGIARFAPYLTGDFILFCQTHALKMATGALSRFRQTPDEAHWQCLDWNIKPL